MERVSFLLPAVLDGGNDEAVRFPGGSLSYGELGEAALQLAGGLREGGPVAVWASPRVETAVAVVAGLLAGTPVVPINPKIGIRELGHLLADSRPGAVLAGPDEALPEPLVILGRVDVDVGASTPGHAPPMRNLDPERPALIVYTSGTTGPPKGVLIPFRALASNLDAQATVWEWTSADVLTHGLPLFHVHGLVLGMLGPLRTGGALHHVGRFDPGAIAAELSGPATMLFGVPTMYHALADAAEADPGVSAALGRARLLVSGSAPLAARDWHRLEDASGVRVVERYGLTETLMNCAMPVGRARPGFVGPPLPEVEVRLVAEQGTDVAPEDAEVVGEVVVRGPNLFLGYLNRPDATAAAMHDGWFRTGDLASWGPDRYLRIVGRRATDLIKTGGFKVGAGEVEAALLEHPAVAEAAVLGQDDERLGQRIVAWAVLRPGFGATEEELIEHVGALLAPHKRPREVRFVTALPRTELGKVVKAGLPRLR